jgi:enoyl-CoA hydratase/carnithine racemase
MAELITRRDGAIGTIVFSNPERMNAVTYDMWSALPGEIAVFEKDPAIRAIVITGDGDRSFISGADISQFEKLRGTAEAQAEYAKAVERAYSAPLQCSTPVIARIQGICIGGGLGLAAACDVRIASAAAVFRMPAARLGLGYSAAGVRRFMNVIGPANTADIFLSARKFNAAQALQMGFVSQVFPVADFDREATAYCRMVSENAPLTLAAAKFAIQQWLKDSADRDIAAATKLVETCFASDDHKEGRKAFMEKRTPVFKGS